MKKSIAWLVVCGVVFAVAAQGAVIVQDYFDGGEGAWLDLPDGPDPNSSWADTGGLGADIHQSSTGDGGGAGGFEYVYTIDSDFTGDWTAMGPNDGIKQIQLDFYADSGTGDGSPGSMDLYFSDSGGQHWFYNVNTEGNPYADWGFIAASTDYGAGWYSTDGPDTEAAFLASIQDVDQVGIYLAYQPGVNDQTYGIDNFVLNDAVNVPEPGTFLFLGVAFASMGMSFRKKLREILASVLKK